MAREKLSGGDLVKTLVVYYSNSGTTKCVAGRIAEQLGAETDEVEEARPRPPLLIDGKKPAAGGALARAALAAVFGMGSSIVETRRNPAEYDLVVVGTPVWGGSLTPAVRSYLKRHRNSIGRVAFFCTAGEPAKHRAFGQMRKTVGREPVATVAVKSDDARGDACSGAIAAFVSRLKTSG
jgi:hypothetical protein